MGKRIIPIRDSCRTPSDSRKMHSKLSEGGEVSRGRSLFTSVDSIRKFLMQTLMAMHRCKSCMAQNVRVGRKPAPQNCASDLSFPYRPRLTVVRSHEISSSFSRQRALARTMRYFMKRTQHTWSYAAALPRRISFLRGEWRGEWLIFGNFMFQLVPGTDLDFSQQNDDVIRKV